MIYSSTPAPDIVIKKCTQETKYDGVNRYVVKTRCFDLGRRRDEKILAPLSSLSLLHRCKSRE